jgi:geranylgeranyl diphosphate synthase, type II
MKMIGEHRSIGLSGRIEAALDTALLRGAVSPAPPTLVEALRHSVFPGGARVRPQLLLAVASACGDDMPALSDAAAAAVELLHCASLVHDDMPCFDDASTRRGLPSTHAVYGEQIALLAGDALIVMAFDCLARAGLAAPSRVCGLVSVVARGVGMPGGIVAGQAWESERSCSLDTYHAAKTGALFEAATMAGAIAAGADPGPWRTVGAKLGAAYQVADDLLDAVALPGEADKPTGQDVAHTRPSAVRAFDVDGAVAHLKALVEDAAAAVPECRGADQLRDLVRVQATRLVPRRLIHSAA